MGMFDYLDINYDLPLPDNATSDHVVFIKNAIAADNFQTKDLDCMLDVYYIDKDGFMYEKIGDNYNDYYIHQHVECYTYIHIPSEDCKYWLEYDIKFTDGKINKVSVVDWRKMITLQPIHLDNE
jgi:hypothetical protein